MSSDPFLVIAVLAVLAVGGILMFGIGGFARGGQFNQKYGNKLMQLRLIAQFIAVILILVVIAMRGQGG